jgi:uncharacterized protein (DUF1330 family)
MAAYLIATVRSVQAREKMLEYWSRTPPSFEGTGAKFLSIYTPLKVLEGEGPAEGVVLIEFPDKEAASRWYESATYQAARQFRVGAADIDILVVDGGVTPAEQRMAHLIRPTRPTS